MLRITRRGWTVLALLGLVVLLYVNAQLPSEAAMMQLPN